jgi:hypothetical protein
VLHQGIPPCLQRGIAVTPVFKNIILLSDGTGNAANKVWKSNVWRVFEVLDLRGDSQIAFYNDGVGHRHKPLAILGGAFGLVAFAAGAVVGGERWTQPEAARPSCARPRSSGSERAV